MSTYKIYGDDNFTADDSPAILDFIGDLNHSAGWIFLNNGPGNIELQIENNEDEGFEDSFITTTGAIINAADSGIRRLQLTHTGRDSSYGVSAFFGAGVIIDRAPKIRPIIARQHNGMAGRSIVHEYSGIDIDASKINYTVTQPKFYIEYVSCALEGVSSTPPSVGIYIEWQVNNTGFYAQSLPATGGDTPNGLAPVHNAFGPFTSGDVITAVRVQGDVTKEWSATMLGYTVNA